MEQETLQKPRRDNREPLMETVLPAPTATPALYRFTIEEYLDMGRAGILTKENRVELIDGQVVKRSPLGNLHTSAIAVLNRLLSEQVGKPYRVVVEGGLNIGQFTQVAPDIALMDGREPLWDAKYGAEHCLLVIEVSLSSLATDQTTRKDIYAAASVPEYWVVDLEGRQVEVYRDPAGGDYRDRKVLRPGDVLTGSKVSGVSVPISEIVPPEDAS